MIRFEEGEATDVAEESTEETVEETAETPVEEVVEEEGSTKEEVPAA